MAEAGASLPVSAAAAAGREASSRSETIFAYLMLAKNLLADSQKSVEFLNILNDIDENLKPLRSGLTEAISRVKYFLRDHPLLILGFSQFLSEAVRHQLLLEEEWVNRNRPVEINRVIHYLYQLQTRFQSEEHLYRKSVEIINAFIEGTSRGEDVHQQITHLFTDHSDLVAEFIGMLHAVAEPKYSTGTVAVNDASGWLQGSTGTGIDEVEGIANPEPAQNIECFRDPETTSRAKHEKILLQCEDDRAEVDLLVEWAAVTARKVKDLLEYMHGPEFKQEMSTFVLEHHLSAINLRCIELIYGDQGLEIIELLRTNALAAVPVVLNRLRQKHGEWFRYRNEMNVVWAEVCSRHLF